MENKLEKILGFTKLLNEFRLVKRKIRVNGEDRHENDIEHSYQLAMLAWYVASSEKLNVDHNLLIKYALVHDIVEVYAGDTFFIRPDQATQISKEAREREAAIRLREEFSEFGELHQLIDQYEKKEDSESKLVFALDKIQPMLNIYTDGGRTWRELGLTLDMLVTHKTEKVSVSPDAKKIFDEVVSFLKEKAELFSPQERV